MALLEWSNEFSVGSRKMDNEHKMIFSMINELDDQIHSGKGYASLPYIFTAMKAYSVYHFASEEALLEEQNDPGLANQKKMHGDFIERISDFEEAVQNREMHIADKVMTFLKSWWIGHIQNEDKKYMPSVLGT